MGANKKIGIPKDYRTLGKKYASRYRLYDHKIVLNRTSGKRIFYLIGTDADGIVYRIRFDKVKKMRSPKGIQAINKRDYLKIQADKVHGENTYDLSLVKDEDITFHNKLDIICNIHGVFKKRKAAFITQSEGCPMCSKNRFNNNRRY